MPKTSLIFPTTNDMTPEEFIKELRSRVERWTDELIEEHYHQKQNAIPSNKEAALPSSLD